jgi:methylmalonyl-CoA mutase
MDRLTLAAEFPEATREAWLKRAAATLKGEDPEQRLVTKTYDGIEIPALQSAADIAQRTVPRSPLLARGAAGAWRIAQAHDDPDPAQANQAIREDLASGAGGLVLRIAEAPGAPGLQVDSLADLDRVLADVPIHAVAIDLDAGARAAEAAALLWALWERRGVAETHRAGGFAIDPLGTLARVGKLAIDRHLGLAAEAARGLAGSGGDVGAMAVDLRPYHAAGCSEAQELAIALATGIAYLRALEAAGLEVEAAARQLWFHLVADADCFLSAAKLRAARLLWSRACNACGIDPQPMRLGVETAARMLAARDPWVNLLRTTLAAFAAGIAGAERITVAPFTAAVGLPDRFARRLARNIPLILGEEAMIARVADPAGGAWAVERLTGDLAARAWTLFQEIEAAGGMAAALTSGRIQAMIAAVRAARSQDIARRRLPLTGLSEFPDLGEAPVTVALPRSPRPSAAKPVAASHWDALVAVAGRGEVPQFHAAGVPVRCQPLAPARLGAAFERLRDASDAELARRGRRPQVFLAALGRPADFTPRATWARNLFEAGGIEARGGETLAEGAAAAAAFAASGARIACLCSSDAVYAEHGAAAAAALKAAGARHVYLAGRPDKHAAALRTAGVDTFVFAGADIAALLAAAHELLETGRP